MIINFLKSGLDSESIIYIVAFLFAVMVSISIHEYAHAFVAKKMGDDTAERLGRLSLNPLSHLDLFGTIAFFVFGFGWAKPVPINPIKFKEYRKGIFLTSIAGVVANLFLAFFSAGFYVLSAKLQTLASVQFTEFLTNFLYLFFQILMFINLQLLIFNLIPIAPLDGFNILYSLTKYGNRVVEFLKRYGTYILLFVLIFVSVVEPYLTFLNGNSLMFYLANLIASPMTMFWLSGLQSMMIL